MRHLPFRQLLPAVLVSSIASGCGGPVVVPARTATPVVGGPDGMFDVGGTQLHLHCMGQGTPTVVLEAGGGSDGTVWSEVQPEIASFTRVCAYDRAGVGYSPKPLRRPHTIREMTHDLEALLSVAQIAGPYVVVAHSLGGVMARLFESERPRDVLGIVLIDCVGDDQPSRFWSLNTASQNEQFRADLARGPEGMTLDSLVTGIADMRNSSRSLGDKPLVVLTQGKAEPPGDDTKELSAQKFQVWQAMQVGLARLSTNSVQVVAEESSHFIQVDAPKLVVAAVREVVDATRTHGRVDRTKLAPLASE